jgi:hypothetical protein
LSLLLLHQCTRYTFGSFDSRVNAPFTPVLNRERKGEGERKRENKRKKGRGRERQPPGPQEVRLHVGV